MLLRQERPATSERLNLLLILYDHNELLQLGSNRFMAYM
jgi:hypothetical protein